MKLLLCLHTLISFLCLLVACTNTSKPAEAPKPMEIMAPTSTTTNPTREQTITKPTDHSPTRNNWGYLSSVLEMNDQRAAHTATLLPDGKVLIAGGFHEQGTSEIPIASAEIYDPHTDAFTPVSDMNEERSGHTATLLRNGQVLIVGGWGLRGRSTTAELFDPKTSKFHFAAILAEPRASMTATLLKNGKVLIAGGDSARNTPQLIAEIYDPVSNTFTQSGSLNHGRSAHTATLLKDGRVLLVGGRPRYDASIVLSSAEIYDPATGKFTFTGNLNRIRYKHAAVRLLDGDVLVIGGSNQDDWSGKYSSAELYDTGKGKFNRISDLTGKRFKLADAAVLLDNGDVLIGGGNREIELFDTQNRRFVTVDKIDDDYYFSVLTLLKDGRVLITGGYDSNIEPSYKAWVYSYN